jgi:hypothetical protein
MNYSADQCLSQSDISCGTPKTRPPGGDPANTRMSDGRHFTDWTPRGSGWMVGARYPHPALASSGAAGAATGPLSSHDMKERLVKSGDALIQADRDAAAAAVSRTWCDALKDMPGFETEQECGEFSCTFAPATAAASEAGAASSGGIGLGRK